MNNSSQPKLYTKIGERMVKLYLLFGKHKDARAATRKVRLQAWSVTGTTRSVSTKLSFMKIVSCVFIGGSVLFKFLCLQRTGSWAASFYSTLRAEGA